MRTGEDNDEVPDLILADDIQEAIPAYLLLNVKGFPNGDVVRMVHYDNQHGRGRIAAEGSPFPKPKPVPKTSVSDVSPPFSPPRRCDNEDSDDGVLPPRPPPPKRKFPVGGAHAIADD